MKKLTYLCLLLLCAACSVAFAAEPLKFEKLVLSDVFYAEGANYGDFNKDGHLDVIAGPYWYEGPDFKVKHEIYPPEAINPEAYSENFFAFVDDFNGDGWPDYFVCPHPGKTSFWYENPKGQGGHWKKHLALEELGNESPMWGDILGTGQKGPVFNMNDYLGFGTWTVENGEPQWKFHAVTGKSGRYQRYTHGIGFGDINGDGRVDLVEAIGWWEQPEKIVEGEPWKFHPYDFVPAAAQMLVYDVDGDGLNDIVTAWHCHLYGLYWYKQIRSADGEITWEKNEILSATPDENSSDFRVSQLHAFYAIDMNGDGLTDFVTGKRFWAHGSKGDKEPNAPAIICWFELKRDGKGGATFTPHVIDDDSGVGTQVVAVDLNNDGIPDTIVSNKKGTFVCLSRK
ncbi:MAG: VCBS repeat-containing protein [Planctomycetaceae bacterium]|nr:VCBS repeat-containing protein [Planctomycetaceae bacterium]